MRRVVYIFRFFRLVAPLPPLMAPAMLAAGLVAAVLIAVETDRPAPALTPLLLLQTFAASSGFLVPARRGHYDLLITGGFSRSSIAVTHWSVSVMPGLLVYVALTMAAVVMGDDDARTLYGPGAVMAIGLVSTLPWAATVGLPRFTGAIGCLLALAIAVAIGEREPSLHLHPRDGTSAFVPAARILTLNPVALVGIEHSGVSMAVLIPALLVGTGSMAVAVAWLSRQDVPLEAAQ